MTQLGGAVQEAPQKQVVSGMNAIILALKGAGGYKYRRMIQLADGQEFNTFVAQAEARMHWMAHCLEVAEAMMHEPPPSMHPRWEEYERRLTKK